MKSRRRYTETLLEEREGVLKVEAFKDGKILAVVNSRLSKEEEEVYLTFKQQKNQEVIGRRRNSSNQEEEEEEGIRFNYRLRESEEDEEDYSDLPPLVSLEPDGTYTTTATTTTSQFNSTAPLFPFQERDQNDSSTTRYSFNPPSSSLLAAEPADRFNRISPSQGFVRNGEPMDEIEDSSRRRRIVITDPETDLLRTSNARVDARAGRGMGETVGR